jgi:hypothetical protein
LVAERPTMVGANSKESPSCRLDQGVGGELEPTKGDVVGHRAESGQGGMLAGEGKAELAAMLPKQALPPPDLGPERVEAVGTSRSFELAPGLLDVDRQLNRELLGAGAG